MNLNKCFYRQISLSILIMLAIFVSNLQLFSQGNNLIPGLKQLTPEDLLARDSYIYTRRAGGPGMIIPENAYSQAIYQSSLLPKDKNLSNSITSTVNWVSVNPIGMYYAVVTSGTSYVSGRTNSVAFHPSNANLFYIGAAQGGVWKTTDGGSTWQVLTDNLATLASGDIAVDQNNPSVLYYATGEMNFSLDSHFGDGIFKSLDGGNTWVQVAATSVVGTTLSKIVIDHTNSNIVYAGGNNGVFKSTNAGINWTSTGAPSGCTSLIIDPTNTQNIYISTGGSSSGSVYKSTDGGGSWNPEITGMPASSRGRIALAMSNVNPLVLYASIASSSTGGVLALCKTVDGANTWTIQATSPNYLGGQGWYDNACCVKTGDPNTVIVGGLDVYVSHDGGVTLLQKSSWYTNNSSNFTHADIHFLTYNGSVLYCCSDGGVYKSADDGNTWTDLNHHLSTLQYQSADYDITNAQKLYGGCQDNNKQYSTDGGNNWTQNETGDGGYTIVDPVNTNYIYGSYVNGSIQRSPDYGISFTEIRPSGSSGGLFYDPYAMAPGDHNTIVFGRGQVWETNNAQTCSQTSGWNEICNTVGGNVSAIGISYQTINKIYVGTSNGKILVTTDNGTAWNTVTGFSYVSGFAVDNTNDNVCYASFGGTSATRIAKTTDGGQTWNSISTGLPSIAVNSIVVRFATPRMIFIGTDMGVYQSVDGGASWISFNSGLPTLQVYDLRYKEGPAILLAATHGRGCWEFNVGQQIGIKPISQIAKTFSLSQNYPNPFNPSTIISYQIPVNSNVKLVIYDVTGRVVKTLVNENQSPGTYQVQWNADNAASGVYFYKLQTEKYTETKKMLLVK